MSNDPKTCFVRCTHEPGQAFLYRTGITMSQHQCFLLCFSGICPWANCTTHEQHCPNVFHYLDPCPLYLNTTSWVLLGQNKCEEPNSAFCTALCYVFLHLSRFLQSLPHTLDLTEFSIFSCEFTYFRTCLCMLFMVHIFAHLFFDFSYCALNFEVKGLKGFVKIGSEITFVISNCHLFAKLQSSQPNWIFSQSSEPLLQILAQNPAQAQGL